MDSTSLILLLAVPLAGALIGAFIPTAQAKMWALIVSLITFAISLYVASLVFSGHAPVLHPASEEADFRTLGASFALGVNTISIWLVLLTTFLQPLAILSSFESIQTRQREYYAWMN